MIEDDTYADLHTGTERPPSLRAFTRTALVLACGSFSKTLASAYRVGWIVPGPYRAELLRLKAATTAGPRCPRSRPSPSTCGVAATTTIFTLKAALRENVDRVTRELANRLPVGTRISSPAGGFLLWIELPDVVDALQLYTRCLRRGVSVAPGPVFSAVGGHRNFIRLNADLLWAPALGRALDVIAEEARVLVRADARSIRIRQ